MRRWSCAFIPTLAVAVMFALGSATAADTNAVKAADPAAAAEASYAATLEKRAGEVLTVLGLTNAAAAAKVHDLVIGQYRALHDWHEANDADRKGAAGEAAEKLGASLKAIHNGFVSALAAVLTPEQVEQVKDKMTYGKVQFTLAGYLQKEPNLTEAQKQKILDLLKEAREEAMDAGSSEEKTRIFTKYKGRINNYLASQGVGAKKPAKAAKATEPKATAD